MKFKAFISLTSVIFFVLCASYAKAEFIAQGNPYSDTQFMQKGQKTVEFRRNECELKSRGIPFGGTDADSVHSWDALHYNIEMEFFPSMQQIAATTTITGMSNEADLDSVPLHFKPGMTVQGVTVAGIPTGYAWNGDNFTVELDRIYEIGDTFEIAVNYAGVPPISYGYFGWQGVFWGNVIYTFTDPEAARNWFPCFDEPFDKATYSARYTLPQNWVMASNGNLDSTIINPDNTITTCWTHNYQIETYLISVSASNYAQFSQSYMGLPINYYVYPNDSTAAQVDFWLVPSMIECYELNYGDYAFEKYGMAEAPIFSGYGAMEHQTITTYGDNLVTGTGSQEFIVCHELAHMWFGDAVSFVDWADMWLSEGFATYSEAIWAHYNYGWYYFLYYVENYIQNPYFVWENPNNRHPIYNPPPQYLFSPVEYEKGASVLHMLRYYMGDMTFFNVMREYYDTYRYGNASTEDFQAVCEDLSSLDLEWFFQQWVYGEGYPVFEYYTVWDSISPAIYNINFGLSQTQDETLPAFMTHIDVVIYAEGEIVDDTTVWVDEREESYTYQYIGPEPDSVRLDPENWILALKYYQGNMTQPVFSYLDYEWSTEFLYPGTSAELVLYLQNIGVPAMNVSAQISSDDPDIDILSNSVDFGYVGFMTYFNNAEEPFVIALDQNAQPHWADLELYLDWSGGDSTIYLSVPVGAPTLIFVDDGGGSASVQLATNILDSIELVYKHWEVNLAGLPQNLEDYEAVIWSCGHATNTLSLEEISLLSTYLNVGGRLFISGTNIASNLAGNGFLSNYLNLQFNQQVNYPIVFGVADDPISDGDTLYLNSQPSDQDAVTPVNGGIACFKYNGVFPCGVRFEGVYKSVALTFAFEDIRWDNPNFDMPDDVVYQILDWLGVSLELEKWVWIVPPEFNLKHNYPNPFNISTKISFILPQSSNVTLKVFNVVGALVLQQDLGEFPPGETSIEWNGKDFSGKTVASGLYVYRLEAKGVTNAQKYTASGKMVMVK